MGLLSLLPFRASRKKEIILQSIHEVEEDTREALRPLTDGGYILEQMQRFQDYRSADARGAGRPSNLEALYDKVEETRLKVRRLRNLFEERELFELLAQADGRLEVAQRQISGNLQLIEQDLKSAHGCISRNGITDDAARHLAHARNTAAVVLGARNANMKSIGEWKKQAEATYRNHKENIQSGLSGHPLAA